jgi:hypothetical protein
VRVLLQERRVAVDDLAAHRRTIMAELSALNEALTRLTGRRFA